MIYFIAIIQLLVAIALVVSILLQSGRGGGLAGSLGGGTTGVSSVFGGRGAGDFLAKLTAGLAIAFVVLTVLINVVSTKPSNKKQESVIATEAQKQPTNPRGGMPTTSPPGAEGVPLQQPAGAGQ